MKTNHSVISPFNFRAWIMAGILTVGAAMVAPLSAQECLVPDVPPGLPEYPLPCPMRMIEPTKIEFPNLYAIDSYLELDGIEGIVHSPTPDGGDNATFTATLTITLSCAPGTNLPRKVVTVPVTCTTHAGPRVSGSAVQSFDTEMLSLDGVKSSDPDFSNIRVRAGSLQGFPKSPGHTTLTRSGAAGTQWRCSGWFDIFTEVSLTGRPGTPWVGVTGKAESRVRLSQGLLSFQGLEVAPMGAGAVVVEGDKLVVNNIGSSGNDGVSFAFHNKPVIADVAMVQGMRIRKGMQDIGSHFTLKGQPPCPPACPPTSVTVGRVATGMEAGAMFSRARSATGQQKVRISVWNGGSRVAVYDAIIICITEPCPTWPLGSNMGRVLLPYIDAMECGVRVATGDVNGDGRADLVTAGSEVAFVEWAAPVSVDIADDGLPPVSGTRVEWSAMPLDGPATGYTQFDVVGSSSTGRLEVEGVAILDGNVAYHGLGLARLGRGDACDGDDDADGLAISNIGSSGQDGVEIILPRPKDSARIKIEIPDGNPPPYNPFPSNSELVLGASGTGGTTSGEHSFGGLSWQKGISNVRMVHPPGTPPGFMELRAAVYNDDALVGSRLMPAAQVDQGTLIGDAGAPPTAQPNVVSMAFVRLPAPLRPYFSIVFDRALPMTPSGGVPLVGNELRLFPTSLAGAVDAVTSLSVTGISLSYTKIEWDYADYRAGRVLANPTGSDTPFNYPPPDRWAVERLISLDNGSQGVPPTKALYTKIEFQECLISSYQMSPTGEQTIQGTCNAHVTLEGAGPGMGTYRRVIVIPHVFEMTRAASPDLTHIRHAVRIKRLVGQLPPGDPDFDLLLIACGSVEGLQDGTGELTASLTLPGIGEACYDLSFVVDAPLQVTAVGKQGTVLAGFSASQIFPSRLLPSSNPAALFAGTDHTALGGARLSQPTTGGSGLIISNIGSSGQDGVSVDLGGVEGYDLKFAAFHLDPPSAVSPGGRITLESWSWGESNAGTLSVSRPGAAHALEAAVDFSHIGATAVQVEWWNGGTFVKSQTVAGNAATLFLNGLPPGTPYISSLGKIGPRGGVSCKRVRLTTAADVSVQGSAEPPAAATEMRLLAVGATFSELDHADVQCSGVTGAALTIEAQSLQLGGRVYTAIGLRESPTTKVYPRESPTRRSARALPPPTGGCFDQWEKSNQLGMAIFPPETGVGTVNIDMPTPYGFSVNMAPTSLSRNGAYCGMTTHLKTAVGDVVPLTHSLQRDTFDTSLFAEYAPMGATQVHVVISSHRGGQKELELDTVLTAGEANKLVSIADAACCYPPEITSYGTAIYWGFHKPGVSDPCSKISFARIHPMTVGATTVQGDTIEIVPIPPVGSGQAQSCESVSMNYSKIKYSYISEVTEGPVWGHGLPTQGIGGVTLGWDPNTGRLPVSNLGSSGQDGVSIDLGKSDGWDGLMDPINMGGLMVHAYGDTPTAANVLLGRIAYSNGWTNLRPACWGADFTALGAASVKVEVMDGTTVTGSFTMPAAAAAMSAPMGPGGKDPALVRCSKLPTAIGPGMWCPPCFALEFDARGIITPPAGGGGFVGDRVRLLVDLPPGEAVAAVTSIELRPGTVWAAIECPAVPITMVSQGLIFADKATDSTGHTSARFSIGEPGVQRAIALGGGHLQGDGPCRIMLGNIGSSGQDGVSFVDLDTDGMVDLAVEGGDLPPVCEWGLSATGVAIGAPPASNGELGFVKIFRDDGTAGDRIMADFSSLGGAQVRVCIVGDDGAVVGQFVVASGTPIPILPETVGGGFRIIGCGKLPGGTLRTPCFFMTFDSLHKIKVTIPGTATPLVGSGIRLLAQGGTARISKVDSFTIKQRSMPPVVISQGSQINSLTSFLSTHFTPIELANILISGLSADPDGDGDSNTLEYAFGTDPRTADKCCNGHVTVLKSTSQGGGLPVVKLSFQRPSGRSGVTTLLDISEDLQHWNPGPAPSLITPLTNSTEEVFFELPIDAPHKFSRFSIEVKP